jgi:hypothetical protein
MEVGDRGKCRGWVGDGHGRGWCARGCDARRGDEGRSVRSEGYLGD